MKAAQVRTHFRQESLLLIVSAVRVNCAACEGGLHRKRGSISAVDALDLSGEKPVSHRGDPGGIVALYRAAEHTELTHFPNDAPVEVLLPIRLDHARQKSLLAVRAELIPHQDLVLRQLRLQIERILPIENS